jgi:hypothetical protein
MQNCFCLATSPVQGVEGTFRYGPLALVVDVVTVLRRLAAATVPPPFLVSLYRPLATTSSCRFER